MRLDIKGVSKTFVTEKGDSVDALSDLSFTVTDREFVCILGPSGCGKTTILRLIAGLDPVSSGSILLDGEAIKKPSAKTVMIFQEYSLYPWRTVTDNVAFGLELRGMQKQVRTARAEAYLDLVGLKEFGESFPYELSGGMRQRVAVARALAVEPAVLLMDEPFGALDAQTRNMLQTELLTIWEKTKKTIIFITHSVDEAVYLADRIIVLTPRPGRICHIAEINLIRPRERTSAHFAQVRRRILDIIGQQCSLQ